MNPFLAIGVGFVVGIGGALVGTWLWLIREFHFK